MFRNDEINQIPRDPFGRILTDEDDDFEALRNRQDLQDVSSLVNLREGVGRDQRNRRRDVARVETLMESNRAFDLSPTDGPTGLFSVPLENAIKTLQQERGLNQDGTVLPDGETINSLAKTIGIIDFDENNNNEPDAIDAPPIPPEKPEPPAESPGDGKLPPLPPEKPPVPGDPENENHRYHLRNLNRRGKKNRIVVL